MTSRLEQEGTPFPRREAVRNVLFVVAGITAATAVVRHSEDESTPLTKKPLNLAFALTALFSLIGGAWIQKDINDNQFLEATPPSSQENPKP